MPTDVTKFSGVIHEEVSGFDSRSRKNVMLLLNRRSNRILQESM